MGVYCDMTQFLHHRLGSKSMPQHEQNISPMSDHPTQQTRTTDYGECRSSKRGETASPRASAGQATRPDGTIMQVRSRQGRAKLPDQDYVLHTAGGKIVGVIVLT